MNLLDRIIEKTKEQNISIRQLERACEMGNGVIDNWSKSWPRSDKLLSVANYLNTSVDYLLTGKESGELTKEEQQLVEAYRASDCRGKRNIMRTAQDEAEQTKELETSSTSRTG